MKRLLMGLIVPLILLTACTKSDIPVVTSSVILTFVTQPKTAPGIEYQYKYYNYFGNNDWHYDTQLLVQYQESDTLTSVFPVPNHPEMTSFKQSKCIIGKFYGSDTTLQPLDGGDWILMKMYVNGVLKDSVMGTSIIMSYP